VHFLAVDAQPAHHYTLWENIGYSLFFLALISFVLAYWLLFKVKAKCLVIGRTTKRRCDRDATVVLGCRQHHKWKKPVAWIRHLGAARWLDPWLYRLHIEPPSFAPMPTPAVRAAPAGVAPKPSSGTPASGMTMEAKIGLWALAVGIVQAGTAIIALIIGSGG
jgi:hypothetical protein